MPKLAEVASDQSLGDKCKTFLFTGEGYTLGKALISVILENPETEFAACFVNHPSDGNIYVRIQAKQGKAVDILKKGLQDLETVCDYTLEIFNTAYEQFKDQR